MRSSGRWWLERGIARTRQRVADTVSLRAPADTASIPELLGRSFGGHFSGPTFAVQEDERVDQPLNLDRRGDVHIVALLQGLA